MPAPPAREDYFLKLTFSLVRAGDPRAALRACEGALTTLTGPILAHLRRGQILYHDLGEPAAAETAFERALAVDLASAAAHYGLARIAFDRLDMDVARHHAAVALTGVDDFTRSGC